MAMQRLANTSESNMVFAKLCMRKKQMMTSLFITVTKLRLSVQGSWNPFLFKSINIVVHYEETDCIDQSF